ncbi:uncharacterized protein LOC135132905 [Zophobas morio]|uniref:uncharacterized protein LOC135132905 n=1 Tax=Zophobas morio TaxID=2755281 RepID=UPI003083E716
MYRFINNCRVKNRRLSISLDDAQSSKSNHILALTINELQHAHDVLIKLVQNETFSQELNLLNSNQDINKSSKLLNLSPFIDMQGIIRVGGRLRNANLSFDKKHPIILPKNHPLTKMIIRHFHIVNLHAGAQATLAAIRHSYWIIAGRNTIRSVLHKCITCFRAKPTIAHQKMGDLPEPRLEPVRPFFKTGVDYCGPIFIKESRGRGKGSTKAVHLELVSDLTSEGFLNALRRFMSRRGQVKELHSDNATNFVGSKNQLKELRDILKNDISKSTIINHLANQNIKWCFIPSRTPNFGGIWEANIKIVKSHMKSVIGEQILTFEEMHTFLTRIEACLNSRPLTPLSSDPNDLEALTPGHFLIGEALTAPVEINLDDVRLNRLSRWQMVEKMRQHFWKRWSREYVVQLQQRNKWKIETAAVQPGAMVLLVEDGLPPLHWPLGRIQEVHHGNDGLCPWTMTKTCEGAFQKNKSADLTSESAFQKNKSADLTSKGAVLKNKFADYFKDVKGGGDGTSHFTVITPYRSNDLEGLRDEGISVSPLDSYHHLDIIETYFSRHKNSLLFQVSRECMANLKFNIRVIEIEHSNGIEVNNTETRGGSGVRGSLSSWQSRHLHKRRSS